MVLIKMGMMVIINNNDRKANRMLFKEIKKYGKYNKSALGKENS